MFYGIDIPVHEVRVYISASGASAIECRPDLSSLEAAVLPQLEIAPPLVC